MSSYEVWGETDVYNLLLDKIIETIEKIVPRLDMRFKYGLNGILECNI